MGERLVFQYRCTVLVAHGVNAYGLWERRCDTVLTPEEYRERIPTATGPCNHILAQYVLEGRLTPKETVPCDDCGEPHDPDYMLRGLCEACLEDQYEDDEAPGCDSCGEETAYLFYNTENEMMFCAVCRHEAEEESDCPTEDEVDRFPHTCGCGSPAYRGLNKIECSRPGCGGVS